jgi:hypothetical protein
MLARIMILALGGLHTLNGLGMILAPNYWFHTVPGVAETGPLNVHFVVDIGLAFLAAGLAYVASAVRAELRPVGFGASGFLVLHASFHLAHLHAGDGSADAAVIIPAFLGLILLWPRAASAPAP